MAKNVVGLFDTPSDAQLVIRDLQSAGFSGDNVNVLRNASSALSSTLEQLGIPGEDATLYLEGIRNGGALVILQQLSDDDASRAADILNRHNIVDIDRRRQEYGQTTETAGAVHATGSAARAGTAHSGRSASSFYQGGETVIPIVEEEVRIGKREVEQGGVRVETRVEEQPVQEQVTLRDEDVRVERRPVDQSVDAATVEDAFREGTFDVRERHEEPVVDKQARVVEEVVVGKKTQERTENVQATERRTDVDVEEIQSDQTSGSQKMGAARGRGTGRARGTTTGAEDDGMIERGLSKAENAVERGTGLDIDRDGDVGQRD